MEEADVIKTLLSDNWNSSNTGDVTPTIDVITNREKIDLKKDHFILLYNTGAGPVTHSAIKTFDHSWTISIDLRTMVYAKYNLFRAEIRRIIEGKYILPATGYHRLYMIRDNDLSDKSRGMYRRVIDVVLTQDLEELTAI